MEGAASLRKVSSLRIEFSQNRREVYYFMFPSKTGSCMYRFFTNTQFFLLGYIKNIRIRPFSSLFFNLNFRQHRSLLTSTIILGILFTYLLNENKNFIFFPLGQFEMKNLVPKTIVQITSRMRSITFFNVSNTF